MSKNALGIHNRCVDNAEIPDGALEDSTKKTGFVIGVHHHGQIGDDVTVAVKGATIMNLRPCFN